MTRSPQSVVVDCLRSKRSIDVRYISSPEALQSLYDYAKNTDDAEIKQFAIFHARHLGNCFDKLTEKYGQDEICRYNIEYIDLNKYFLNHVQPGCTDITFDSRRLSQEFHELKQKYLS